MRHRIRQAALIAAALATTLGAAEAAPITTLFNTGVDATGAPQANQATELHYLPESGQGFPTGVRVATSANGFQTPPWLGNNGLSAWVGPNTDGALT